MIERLRSEPALPLVASAPRADYAVLLAHAAALVGNSSSGVTEAPLLRVPAVDIGERQAGRLAGDNVVHADPNRASIGEALRAVLAREFRDGLSGRSPHGDGHAAERIAKILADEPMGPRLLVKRTAQEELT
jgi:UDP-N-acetylglucosamine 2-epimerase